MADRDERPSRRTQFGGAADAFRLLIGGRSRAAGAIVLAYHDVGEDPANTTDYYVSTATFRRHLLDARGWGLRFVALADLTAAFLAGGDLDGMAAVVFDDSLVGVHHHAMPVLLELGIPSTVFTVTNALGQSPPWWSGAARVMTHAEVTEMAEHGFDIASHTRTHASLPSLSDTALAGELTTSKAELEDLTSRPGATFAYPYGHHDPRVREAVEGAGYLAAFSFLNGRVTQGLDRFMLPRLNMHAGQSRTRLAYHLARSAGSWPDTQRRVVLHEEHAP